MEIKSSDTLRPIQKLMLIFPPMVNARIENAIAAIPLGIASLAAFLRDKVDVVVLDAVVEGHHHRVNLDSDFHRVGLSYDAIQDRIEAEAPDLLGVSCLISAQFPSVREIVARAKAWDPDMVCVTGGTHPSFLPERALTSTQLDYVVLGEGELPLAELIDRHNNERSPVDMPALALRSNGAVRVNRKYWMVDHLDALPLPAREMFPVEKYFKIHLPMQGISRSRRNLSIATSRGCPFQCTFCSSCIHWGERLRLRSVDKVLDEMEILKTRFGIKEIKFEDDNLTHDREHARRLFQGMIDRGLNLHWNTPNGISARHLDDDMLQLMKKSGCYELTVAVESGDEDVLRRLIRKPITLTMVREAVRRIKAHGIGTNGYFICGFPGETRQNIENTFRLIRELKLDRHYLFMYSPLPGTPLARMAVEQGRLPEDYDYEKPETYFTPSVQLSEVPPRTLKKMWRRTFMISNLRLVLTNPVKFFRKYGAALRSHPEFLIKFFQVIFK